MIKNRRIGSKLVPLGAAALATFGSLLAAPSAQADEGGALLHEINATRAANGCPPVAPNPQLTAAATRHARDMLASGVRAHTGSDGSSVVQRTTDAGYVPYRAVGEVVFWSIGPGVVPATAVDWWMNSPSHRAIVTDCGLTEAGFSALRDGDRMTAAGDFGAK